MSKYGLYFWCLYVREGEKPVQNLEGAKEFTLWPFHFGEDRVPVLCVRSVSGSHNSSIWDLKGLFCLEPFSVNIWVGKSQVLFHLC